jgi:DNA-binding SARP family transcriptional activator
VDGPHTSIAIRTFGGLRVSVGGVPVEESAWPVSARRLLELLLCVPDHRTTAAQAAELLWPGHLSRSALNSFNVAVHRLRRVLEPGLGARAASRGVVREGRAYRLPAESIACDRDCFERLLREGALERAVGLYRGDFLQGSSETFVEPVRARMREIALDALDGLAAAHREAGDLARAIRGYERLLALAPHREDAWARLLDLHLAAGDGRRAAAALRRCQRALHRAGITPSGLLRELRERVREL